VQGNLDLGAQWRQELYGENLERYLRLTMDAARRSRPKLVVWPEAAFTFFLETEPMYAASLASVLRPFDLDLVAGGPHVVPGVADTYTNAAFAIEPSGAIRGRYDKERLLPFAEYYPLGSLGAVRRGFGGVRTFVPGPPSSPLPTAAGKAGILICNEAMFPELARARVRDGAELLLVLTNDTWVGSPKFAGIAFDMTVLRAIETRRWTVRASTAGPSAIIDPTGAVHATAAFDTTATVAGDVAARSGLTVYARWGDVFAIACAAATFLAVMAAVRRRARAREAV
jgi:apolipoprotein N-acyltransferase